jgi:hypothetical protein
VIHSRKGNNHSRLSDRTAQSESSHLIKRERSSIVEVSGSTRSRQWFIPIVFDARLLHVG